MAEIAGSVGVRMFMDAGDFVRGSKAAQKEADRLQASLLQQERVLRMGANEAKLYGLAISGVSTEQIRAIRTQQEVVAGLEKQTFGFNNLVKILRGGGILIGVKLLSSEFLRMSETIEKVAASGGKFDDLLDAVVRGLPIVGNFVTAWDKLANAISGAAAEAERVKRAGPGVQSFKSFQSEAAGIVGRADIAKAPDDATRALIQYNQALAELTKNYEAARLAVMTSGLTGGFHFKELAKSFAAASKGLQDILNTELLKNPSGPPLALMVEAVDPLIEGMKAFKDEAQFDFIGESLKFTNEEFDKMIDNMQRSVELQNEMKKASSVGPPELAEFGSAAAIRIANRSISGAGGAEERQLAEQRRQTKLQEDIERNTRTSGAAVANF